MINKIKKVAEKKIRNIQMEYILSHYETVAVRSGEALYNRQCHRNAVQHAKRNNEGRVAIVLYLSINNDIILHFVNYDGEGALVDNTLGHESKENTYYFVMNMAAEYDDARTRFSSIRDYMIRILPWYLRKFNYAEI